MSFPVNPVSSLASQPKLVSLPQTQRIIQDIDDCVHQLKEDFSISKLPITDDNQVLQRFCAKLEYLLQYEMKERFTLLGKRKDYWDYFCDCLASNKGANDGIKYVKALGEHKTSLGKGRAFIRFALVHQRLADSLQQCIIHPKTGEWFNTASVWMQSKVSSAIVGNLYDLNDLHFDLSPRGYDLDNAWPSFARNTGGAGNWNIPASRRSSVTSMDTLSLVSTDPSEINRLQQELASAETARSALAESVTTLEQERQRAEKSVWMTQGELNAMQEQMRSSAAKFEELQQQHSALEQSHTRLLAEKAEQAEKAARRAAELDDLQQELALEKEQLAGQKMDIAQQLTEERSRSLSDAEALQRKLNEVTDARNKLSSKVASLEENMEQMRSWDVKKDQQISRLEQQMASLEQRNNELTAELAKNLTTRELDATNQLETAQKVHDLLSKLKEVEAENIGLQGSIIDLKHKCEVLEKSVQEEQTKGEDLQSRLSAEVRRSESLSVDLRTVSAELEKERSSTKESVVKLQSDCKLLQEESERTKAELNLKVESLAGTEIRQADLTNFISQLMQVVLDLTGAKLKALDVMSCCESDMTEFIEACQKSSAEKWSSVQNRLEAVEKREATLTAERELLQQTVGAIINTLPDKPDCSAMELSQQTREVETRVQSLCKQWSDAVTDNKFLREQLHLAQGEHSDKGKQLSHLEGRLLELEKVLKESRASESSLQGQVAGMEVTLKNAENQSKDLQCQLQTALQDASSKADALSKAATEKMALEKLAKDWERQAGELKTLVEAAAKEREEIREREEGLKGKVQELGSSLEVSQQQLEEKVVQLSSMQEKLREGEETVEKFLASMAALETDKASIVTEQDTLRQQVTDTSSQLHAALKEKQEEQTAREEAQREVTELTEKLSQLTETVEGRDSQVKSLQESLQASSHRHAEEVDQLRKQLEGAQEELIQIKEQLHQTSARLSEVTAQKDSVEAERDSALQKLQEMSSELKEKEVSFLEEIQNLKVQLENFKMEKEEWQKSASSSQEEKTKLLSEKQNLVASLQQEKTMIEKQVKDLLHKKESLEAEVQKAQGEVEELKLTVEKNKEASALEFHQTQNRLQADINSLRQQNADLTSQLENVSSDLKRKTAEMEEARAEVESRKTESERLRSDSATERSELEHSLEELQSRFSELQTAMDALIKEKEDLTTLQVTTQEELIELKADLASSADGYNFLLQSSQRVYEEKDAEIEALKSQLAALEQSKNDLSVKLDASSEKKDSMEVKLQHLESEELVWKEKVEDLDRRLTEKNKEADDLRELVKSLTSSVSILEEEDRGRRGEIERLESALQDKDNSYTMQVESLQQELSALQFQLSAEQLQHEESVRAMGDNESSVAEMSNRLTEQEAFISELEKELSTLQAEFETERANQSQQLEELKMLLKGRETECRQLAEKLQRTSDKLEETLSSAELYQKENSALRKSLDHDIEEREVEIRTLRSDNDDLKKELIKLVRAKAALWQQTDALAYEHKRKSEGRWLDNSTVTKCMGCAADFSLFLRKHHCRLCGRIFCYNCSDNWVDSTSSSHKARACGQCFADLKNLDASVAKASLLPDDSDDEGSNVGSDAASQQGSVTDDRAQSSPQQVASRDASLCAGQSTEAGGGSIASDNSPSAPDSSGEDIYAGRESSPEQPDPTSTPKASASNPSDSKVSESSSNDGTFQVITQEEVTKSIAAYGDAAVNQTSMIDVPNMSSSMLLSAEDLARGEINTQSETWVKPGCSFAVPIRIDTPYTVVSWEFTVHPKDIQFSITYHHDEQEPVSQAEVVVAPTRCHSREEPVRGELTAKAAGIYTLVFNNSYSRMTSKKIHYSLKYDA